MKMVSVAQKLSTTKEQSHEQSRLLRKAGCSNKCHGSEKLSWVRLSVKTLHIGSKLSTTERRKNQNRFSKEITRTDVTNTKTVLDSSLGEDFGFIYNNNNNIVYNI
jgi:hypothetical protein